MIIILLYDHEKNNCNWGGGGEIENRNCKAEIFSIDKKIIKLSNKKNPKFLFIPTASFDAETYCNNVKKYFGDKLKCKIDILYLVNQKSTNKEIKNKILSQDIIYVGGGNTLNLMRIWKRLNIDKILKKAYNKGIILCGLSAGANCWFKYSNSNSRKFKTGKKSIKVTGLNLINALCCPHYDIEKHRRSDLKKMMKRTKEVAIALDNCCAIEIANNQYKIISSRKTAKAYKIYWRQNKYVEEKIENYKNFQSLNKLLEK